MKSHADRIFDQIKGEIFGQDPAKVAKTAEELLPGAVAALKAIGATAYLVAEQLEHQAGEPLVPSRWYIASLDPEEYLEALQGIKGGSLTVG